MSSLFNCQLQEVLSTIYMGDHPLTLQYGGVAIIDHDNFLVAGKTTSDIYWVYKNTIVSSCKIHHLSVKPVPDEEWQCYGLTLASNCRDGFMLVMNQQGLMKILRFSIDREVREIAQSPALTPLCLSQRIVPYKGSSRVVEWNGSVDYSAFHLTSYVENTEFLVYHPTVEVGPALRHYPPCMCLCGNKLVISINHWQFFSVQQKHIVTGLGTDQFKQWAAQVKSLSYDKNNWWFESWTGTVEAHTPTKHPTFISSLLVVDPISFRIEGISHVGSSLFSKRTDINGKFYIQSIFSQEDVLELVLNPISHIIERDQLRWGTVPFIQYLAEKGSAGHLFNTFLLWWDQCHMSQDLPTDMFISTLSKNTRSARVNVEDLTHFTRKPITLVTRALDLPFNTATPIHTLATSGLVNTAIGVSDTSLFKYNIVCHELESWEGGTLLGTGLDVQIGETIAATTKTIKVKLKNIHEVYTLHTVMLQVESDELNSSYLACALSADGHVWFDASSSLTLNGQVHPSQYLEFYVKVSPAIVNRQPAPIRLRISYTLTW